MARKKTPFPIYEKVSICDYAAEGKSIARITIPAHDGQEERNLVVFVPWCAPGDIVDLQIRKKKHNYAEADAIKFHQLSKKRTAPKCQHFGTCGGCKWQHMVYEEQLQMKQKQVFDQLTRIGHLTIPSPGSSSEDGECVFYPIMGSSQQYEYRNKLDFGAANKRYLTKEEIATIPYEEGNSQKNMPALGFHITGAFDKILPIEHCYLMPPLHNLIRNHIRDYAIENQITFFDLKTQTGMLRDVIIRNSNSGEWMVIIQVKLQDDSDRQKLFYLLEDVSKKFMQISSLLWVDNQKCNDTFGDLTVHVYKGKDHIVEIMEGLRFKVGPKSFYQTNTDQAYQLYSVAREYAGLTGNETVYDLYTGTGTIANFVAQKARQVIGIEYVPEAIEDAKENSKINNIHNTLFYAGDMKNILTEYFIQKHGNPDVIITDPPRAGMHPDVVQTIIKAAPRRIVYISCNPATQARDLEQLSDCYRIKRIQPVDMFPHTPHVENVVLLEHKAIDPVTIL